LFPLSPFSSFRTNPIPHTNAMFAPSINCSSLSAVRCLPSCTIILTSAKHNWDDYQ
jgi:hypothetical protein